MKLIDKNQDIEQLLNSLTLFFGLTSEMLLILEADIIIDCSENFAKYLGAEKSQIIYQSISEFIYKEDQDFVSTRLKQPQSDFVKLRLLRRDNSVKWIQFKNQSLPKTNKILFIFKEVDDFAQIQNKLSIIMEAVREGYWDWDLRTNEAFYDDQWYKLLGYSPGEAEPSSTFWEERIHPEDKEFVFSALNDHMEERTDFYQTEHRVRTKTGEYTWVLDMGKVIVRDAEHKPQRIIGVTLDISKRVATEHQLLMKEERYRSIYEHLSDGFCRFSFNGIILEANEILASLLKIPLHLLKGKRIHEFVPAKTAKTLMKLTKNIIQTQSLTTETDIVTHNGKRLTVSISAKLIVQNNQRIIQALIRDITIVKEFERILVEEKQKFKLLVENSPEMMLRLSRSFEVLYISPNFKEIIPGNIPDLIDMSLNQIGLPPNIQLHIEQSAKSIFKRPRSLTISFSFISNNNEFRYEAILTPERTELNVVESVLITFRKVAEKIPPKGIDRSSKIRLEEAEKIVHFGSFEYEMQKSAFYLSRELLHALDMDTYSSFIELEKALEFIHPDDKVVLTQELTKSLRDKSSLNLTFRIISQSGNEKHLHCLAEIIYNQENEPVRMTGTILDITEKRKIQELLAHERDSLQTIMDNVPDAIYFKNASGQYLRVNEAFSRQAGFDSPDEIVGKTDFDIYDVKKATESYEEDQFVISTGHPVVDKQDIHIRPTGEKLWFLSTKVGIRDAHGKITQIVGISRDVTQFILAGEELKRAKEKAEQADNLKSAFLANMSHEIRTPINGILGFASLLEMREFPREKEKKYLSIINNSGKLLLNLINDIIDIAKIEAGQINIEQVLVEINGTLRELKEFYHTERLRRDKQNVEIKLTVPDEIDNYFVLADINRLKQILNNLISNALKFTDSGFVEFGYKKQTQLLLFYVRDTGHGISDTEKEVIFERFKQAGMGSRKKEGTGLGLAISKGLVELMGGKIWVESEPGDGSTFYFSLPLSEPEFQPSFLSAGISHSGKRTTWENQKVLLVEDEEANYLYVQELLSDTGLNLIHAKSGEEAIEFCSNQKDITLVLMDIRLPGINGIEALSRIRNIHPLIPVIAQTAFAMENEREYCLNAGCNDYISKPFDQEGLFKILERFLLKKKLKK